MLFDNNAIIYPTNPEYNIYYRLSGQLREHLIKNGFCVDEVSRVHIGEKEYYALDFNLKKDEWSHRKTNHTLIAKLLKVKNVGLVDFFNHDDMVHEVILIDEDELNDKYVVDGNFDFTKKEADLLSIPGDCKMIEKRFRYWFNEDGEECISDKYNQFKMVDLCSECGEQVTDMLNELEREKEYWRDKALHKELI